MQYRRVRRTGVPLQCSGRRLAPPSADGACRLRPSWNWFPMNAVLLTSALVYFLDECLIIFVLCGRLKQLTYLRGKKLYYQRPYGVITKSLVYPVTIDRGIELIKDLCRYNINLIFGNYCSCLWTANNPQ